MSHYVEQLSGTHPMLCRYTGGVISFPSRNEHASPVEHAGKGDVHTHIDPDVGWAGSASARLRAAALMPKARHDTKAKGDVERRATPPRSGDGSGPHVFARHASRRRRGSGRCAACNGLNTHLFMHPALRSAKPCEAPLPQPLHCTDEDQPLTCCPCSMHNSTAQRLVRLAGTTRKQCSPELRARTASKQHLHSDRHQAHEHRQSTHCRNIGESKDVASVRRGERLGARARDSSYA